MDPELKDLTPKIIHAWEDEKSHSQSSYPHPMVNHQEAAKEAIKRYKFY